MIADQIQIPMMISAIAVLITLTYASILDVRERRVPFRTWIPMLFIGLVCTSYMFWEKTQNASLVCGYWALVAVFLYDDYLGNRGREDAIGLTRYYRKSAIFLYLPLVLILPALSWFVFVKKVSLQIVSWYCMLGAVLLFVSYIVITRKSEENRQRRKKGSKIPVSSLSESICRWYFVLVLMIFAIMSIMMYYDSWGIFAYYILFMTIFCGIFYIFGTMNLFGWADAWALIFISFCIPVFPMTPLFGEPPVGVFSFSVLTNALILNLVAPLAIFILNIAKRTRGPLLYMFFGFPVKGKEIQKAWGFVMEEMTEENGVISRRFIGFWDAIRRMFSGTGRVYTKELRENPAKYAKELAMYKKAGTVWISYAVPFILPVTAGFITAVVFGDFLYAIMTLVTGAYS